MTLISSRGGLNTGALFAITSAVNEKVYGGEMLSSSITYIVMTSTVESQVGVIVNTSPFSASPIKENQFKFEFPESSYV